jgi:hypothetical protein
MPADTKDFGWRLLVRRSFISRRRYRAHPPIPQALAFLPFRTDRFNTAPARNAATRRAASVMIFPLRMSRALPSF